MNVKIQANIDVLKKDVDSSLKNLTERRRENKKKAQYVVVGGAAISAFTAISIGMSSLKTEWAVFLQPIALALSSVSTIVVAWDGFYNHKRLWLLHVDIVRSLQDIQTDIRHIEANGNPDQDELNFLYARYKSSIGEFNEQWKDLRTENNDEKP